MLHRSSHRWKHKRKAFFGIFRSSPIAFDLMSSMVANRNSSPRKAFLSSPNHRTLRISLQVTFGCSLLWKWASRGHVSHPWRTSNRMQRPNSGRFWKKPSAGASNSSRIDGASVCVCVCVCVRARARVLLWRWLDKRCHMSYHYSAIPQFRELFDWPSYITTHTDYTDFVLLWGRYHCCTAVSPDRSFIKKENLKQWPNLMFFWPCIIV